LVKGQTAASEETGVPLTTVNLWYHDPRYVELRTTAREEVIESMWAAAQAGIASMVKSLDDPKTPLRDKTDAASMLVEKYLLLRGEATERTEHRALTEDFDDGEVDAIQDWLLDLARKRMAAEA
jgi:hypothetical protein